MGGIFGKEKKAAGGAPAGKKPAPKQEVTEQERAVLDLKNQRDKLHKYRKQLEGNIQKEKELAKQALAAGNKNKAMLMLKKKKYQEGLLEKAEQLYINLDELVNSVEFASQQKEYFERLKRGKDMLEAINNEMKLEDVERLMEDNQEAIAYQNQITEALSGQLSPQDEADVLAELEALTGAAETAAKVKAPVQAAAPAKVQAPVEAEATETSAAAATEDLSDEAAAAALDALEDMPDVPTKPLPSTDDVEKVAPQKQKPQLVAA